MNIKKQSLVLLAFLFSPILFASQISCPYLKIHYDAKTNINVQNSKDIKWKIEPYKAISGDYILAGAINLIDNSQDSYAGGCYYTLDGKYPIDDSKPALMATTATSLYSDAGPWQKTSDPSIYSCVEPISGQNLCKFTTSISPIFGNDFSTLSLNVYHDPSDPPLSNRWEEFMISPPSLTTDGFYASAYRHLITQSNGQKIYGVIIAFRGTYTAAQTHDDYQVMIGKIPNSYSNDALPFINNVLDFINTSKNDKYILVGLTGHSLGAIYAELAKVSLFGDLYTVTFESPGSKTLIKNLSENGILPHNALENAPNNLEIVTNNIDGINTTNEQLVQPEASNPGFEDFSQIEMVPPRMGPPGDIYYFIVYTIKNQHRMRNIYDCEHGYKNCDLAVINAIPWPIGYDTGYFIYTNYNNGGVAYWNDYMNYLWNHSDVSTKFIDKTSYDQKFISALNSKIPYYPVLPHTIKQQKVNQANLKISELSFYVKSAPRKINKIVQIKNYNFKTKSLINLTKIKQFQKRPTLDEIINQNLDGLGKDRKQAYETANNDKKLYYAVIAGDNKLAEDLIINQHANINIQYGENHYSLLQIAIMFGYLDTVDLLVKNKINLNIIDDLGNTALHTIALSRYEDAVDYAKLLILAGANSEIKNKAGETPDSIMQKHCPQCINAFAKSLLIKNDIKN